MIKYLIFLIVILGVTTSCSIYKVQTDYTDSVIAETMTTLGTTPDVTCKIITVGDVACLEKDYYTATQAENFVNDIVDAVTLAQKSEEILISDVINYVSSKYALLPSKVQVALIILDIDQITQSQLDLVLTETDYQIILSCLEKQLQIIELYK